MYTVVTDNVVATCPTWDAVLALLASCFPIRRAIVRDHTGHDIAIIKPYAVSVQSKGKRS